ncbi:unnamed protein product [Thelazia callipaeda]|uniref:ethanolamine kinase n=1 Tax=Thelazia callipaeda TaxID=103827 RepID=A0A0N5CZ51_THECL|nr:unnamed protein product [Thelazia callipaeda]
MPVLNDILSINVEMPLNDENSIKERALFLIETIKPSWDREFISFKILTGGITNRILCATYTPTNITEEKERLLIRIYGNNTSKIIDRTKEIMNWLFLASHGCAAEVYARFSNGIISGFIPGNTLTVDNICDENIVTNTCKSLSKMHKLRPDTGSETKPVLLFKIRQYLANFSDKYEDENQQLQFDNFFKQNEISFVNDMERLGEIIDQQQFRIVFCHNDLLIHNIIHDKKTGSVSFIDFEYADYNYQAFDIANHFCEYAGVENFDYSRCPDEEYKRIWITKYLNFFLERNPTEHEINSLLHGCNVFEAASHFFWALWALVQSQISTINFDYLAYAIQRYQLFQKCMLENGLKY